MRKILNVIGAFKNLKELDLSYNEIADDQVVWGFNRLGEYHAFPSLYTLNMSNNLLTQEVIHQIQGIKEQGYFPTLTELLF